MEKLLEIRIWKLNDELFYQVKYQNFTKLPRGRSVANNRLLRPQCSIDSCAYPELLCAYSNIDVYLMGYELNMDTVPTKVTSWCGANYGIQDIYTSIGQALEGKFGINVHKKITNAGCSYWIRKENI